MTDIETGARVMPGLIRMLVVNFTLMEGRIEELPLDEHTALIAHNQAGKTSLMSLTPFFLGARKSQIVSSRERLNFINFYLPREESYIAFEYRNARGDVRSVVMHSNPSRTEVQYRFLRSGLSAELFLRENEDGEREWVRAQDFERHARRLGYQPAERLIEVNREYRGIIQGFIDTDSPKDRSFLQGMIAEFGLGSLKNPLIGIDRLAITTLQNSFSINDLLGILARQIIDSDDDAGKKGIIHLVDAKSKTRREYPEQFRAYRSVMEHEPSFRETEKKAVNLTVVEDGIASEYDRLAGAELRLARELIDLEDEKSKTTDAWKDSKSASETEIAIISERIGKTEGGLLSMNGEISDLREQERILLSKGADKAQQAKSELPSLRSALARTEATLEALNGNGKSIVNAFERNSDRLKDAFHKREAELAEANSINEERLRKIADGTRAEAAAAEAHAREQAEIRSSEINAEIVKVDQLRDALSREALAITADSDVILAQERAKTALIAADATLRTAAASCEKSRVETGKAKDALSEIEREVLKSQANEVEAVARHARLVQRLSPEDGSFHAWLSKNHPDWGTSIGRLVHPELLRRRDLSPRLADGQSIYGVAIDIEKIDLPEFADREKLEAAVESAHEAVKAAKAMVSTDRKALEKAAALYRNSSKEQTRLETELQLATQSRDRRREELQLAEEAVQESVANRRKDVDARMAEASRELQRHHENARIHEADLKTRIKSLMDGLAVRMTEANAAFRMEQESIEAQRQSVRENFRKDIARNKTDLAAALSEKGADPERIRSLSAERDELAGRISANEALSEMLAEWNWFLGKQKPKLDSLPARISAAEQQIRMDEDRLADRKATFKAAVAAHEAKIEKLVKRIAATARAHETCVKEIENGKSFGYRVEAQADEQVIETPEAIITSIRSLDVQRKSLTRTIIDDLGALQSRFLQKRGVIHDFMQDGMAKSGSAAASLKWLPIFASWYNERHVEVSEGLRLELRAMCHPIRKFYIDLSDADREISTLNRRLRDAIRSNVRFPGITDIDLHVRSRISAQPFWADLQRFDELFGLWEREIATSAPDELVDAMAMLFEHWSDGGAPTINIREMMYLEGTVTEGRQTWRMSRDTKIEDLSSEGGSSIIRLIILTAAITIMRSGSNVIFTWCVDEFGRLDRNNGTNLVRMLGDNGIRLVTGAPNMDIEVMKAFQNRLSITARPDKNGAQILRSDNSGIMRRAVREWTDTGELVYPEVN